MVQMRMMMLFIVVVVSCVMMKIVLCSALSHEVLNSQHYKHSQSTEACADDAKKWAGFTTACAANKLINSICFIFRVVYLNNLLIMTLINYKMFCFVRCLAGLCYTSLYINICQCGCNIFSFKCC